MPEHRPLLRLGNIPTSFLFFIKNIIRQASPENGNYLLSSPRPATIDSIIRRRFSGALHFKILLNYGIMKVELHRVDDAFHLRSTNEDGLTVDADGSPDIGGHNQGLRPMQMLLASLGSCSAIDVILLLRKQRQPLADLRITVEGQRADTVPKVFTDIHLHYHLYGEIDDKKAERAVELSMTKLCSVSRMLEKSANITWAYTVHPPG